MTINSVLVLIKMLFASVILAAVYRGYLALVREHQNAALQKDNAKVQQDLRKDNQDAKTVQAADQDLAAAIVKFEKDSGK